MELDFEEIYTNIVVYRNLLPHTDLLADLVRNSETNSDGSCFYGPWSPWYTFGSHSAPTHQGEAQSQFGFSEIYRSAKNRNQLVEELLLSQSLDWASRAAFADYVHRFTVPVPDDWMITTPSLARYFPGVLTNEHGFTMNFHTDYVIGEWWWPGEKFLLTCTTYLNDDYGGGEIVFYMDNKLIPYKPSRGDVLVFPSGDPLFPGNNPYFHGVAVVEGSDKLLVRNYLKYKTRQNEDIWKAKQDEFGVDEWWEMAVNEAKHHSMIRYEDIAESVRTNTPINYSETVRNLYNMN